MKTATIKVLSLNEPNPAGWRTAKTDLGNLSIPPGKALEANTGYDVEIIEKTGQYGAYWILHNVIRKHEEFLAPPALASYAPPSPIPAQALAAAVNGRSEKDALMSKMAAQKNSAILAQAYASVIVAAGCTNGLKESEVKLWIDSYRKATFEVMLKELNG